MEKKEGGRGDEGRQYGRERELDVGKEEYGKIVAGREEEVVEGRNQKALSVVPSLPV